MQPVLANTQCCCCSARTGLRVLGWWWLVEIIFSSLTIWVPVYWSSTVVAWITYIPCFFAFLGMTKHNDKPEGRLKLYKTYKLFACIIGMVLMFASTIYIQMDINRFYEWECARGIDCPPYTYIPVGYAIMAAAFQALIFAVFRFYFLSVMKKYHEEGVAFHAAGFGNGPQPMVGYGYQPMQPGFY